MTMNLLSISNILLLLCSSAHSFAPSPSWGAPHRHCRRASRLYYNDDRYVDNAVRPIPNDFQLFLTQCSIQSFMFLLKSMRDPETVLWLEAFTKPAICERHNAIGVVILEDARVVQEQQYANESNEKKTNDGDGEKSVLEYTNDDAKVTNDVAEPASLGSLQRYHVLAASGTTSFSTKVMEATNMTMLSSSVMALSKASIDIPAFGINVVEAPRNDEASTEEENLSSEVLQYHVLTSSMKKTDFPAWVSSVMDAINMKSPHAFGVMKPSNKAILQTWGVNIMEAVNASGKDETKESAPIKKYQQYHVLAASHPTTFATWVASIMTTDLTIFPTYGTSVVKASKNRGIIPFEIWGVKQDTKNSKNKEEAPIDIDEECPVEEPRKSSKLLQYHGLAALNTTIFPTWDSYFEKLLQEPVAHLIVESHSAVVPEYELDIDPLSLCSRLVSVREQISREFVRDLEVISNMGNRSLESYWENMKKVKSSEEDTDEPVAIERENLLFLELNVGDHAPSPLRKGNFDLLMLLATQESIHRVLDDENRQGGPERVTNEYLKQFYLERIHYFRGPQRYGRADDFLEELLSRSPRMITVAEGITSLIDPTRIAELVLNARRQVALEWKELAAEASKDHMEIQRMRLNRMMGVTKEETEEPFQ